MNNEINTQPEIMEQNTQPVVVEQKKNNSAVVIVIVVICLLLGGYFIYKNISNKKPVNSEPTYSEEDDGGFYEVPTREVSIDNQKAINKALLLGYKETTDSQCRKIDKCYTDGNYLIQYSTDSDTLAILVKKKIRDFSNYDSTKDLQLIETLYDVKISEKTETINKLIRNLSTKHPASSSFRIDTEGIGLSFMAFTDNLRYTINSGWLIDDFDPIELSFSTSYEQYFYYLKESIERAKTAYDITMENNKKHFSYYDIAYSHIENDSKENGYCGVLLKEKKYQYSFEQCNPISSRISYEPRNDEGTSILLTIRGKYFDKYYLSVINRDIDYLNKKLNKNYSLSDDMKNNIKQFIDNEQVELVLFSDEDLTMTLYGRDHTNVKYYIIEIVFNK